jgi:cytochrome c-type biogenesis protein CcmH
VTLRGSVSLDPRLRDRVRSGDTLFVFARAADERGPPLAVLRTAAGPWPLSFELDDRNSMLPGRSLSGFNRVILEARISRSGNALPQPGDLRAVSAVLDPRTSPAQRLTIAEEVSAPPAGGG